MNNEQYIKFVIELARQEYKGNVAQTLFVLQYYEL